MSSQEEGLGSSVLDAFQYRVPVVSTNAGGLQEVVDGNGLLCHVKDSEALALSMNEVLNDTELTNAIVENAFETVNSKYSLKHVTDQYIKIFESLISAK